MQIREWHIVISGFLQRAGDVNGVVNIWGELIDAVSSEGRQARVELRSWHDDTSDLAELISRLQPQDAEPIINIYGYSWGGMTAALLARQLNRRGIGVARMVLSDAVYRHWYWLGQWRAFVPGISIQIPDNVKRVTAFRQSKSWPRGHSITAVNPGKTHIDSVKILNFEHCWMDDAPQFRRACIEAAKGAKP